jgi:hypothetical protein
LAIESQSKNRLNKAGPDELFHKTVVEALNKHGKRSPFRVPVAIRMHFHLGIDKPAPQIQSLPKHYLDLLQLPRDPGNVHSTKLLLQDDRLVKVLICTCSFAEDTLPAPFVSFEISTLTDFAHELRLYENIIGADYHDSTAMLERIIDENPIDPDTDTFDAVKAYRHTLALSKSVQGAYKDLADISLRIQQESAQYEILSRREPQPIHFAKIYDTVLARRRKIQHPLGENVTKMFRELFGLSIASINLGSPGLKPGESGEFKKMVRHSLIAMRATYPIFEPLLTTVGITILYIPPLSGQNIDLDNLARRVVPFVHDQLKPPATLLHALPSFRPAVMTGNLELQLKRLNRVSKHQVTRYQVFELPRLVDDPPEGRVSLVLHGRNEYRDPWLLCRSTLDAWSLAPLRSITHTAGAR